MSLNSPLSPSTSNRKTPRNNSSSTPNLSWDSAVSNSKKLKLSSTNSSERNSASSPTAANASASSTRAGFTQFTVELTEKADEILNRQIPKKIIELENFHEQFPPFEAIPMPDFAAFNLIAAKPAEASEASGAVQPASDASSALKASLISQSRSIPPNPTIAPLLAQIRCEVHYFLQAMSQVKFRVQLNIPEADEGNNFGVEIQEEAISEVSRVEEIGYSMLEKLLSYSVNRGKICSKIAKFPLLEDWWRSLRELDEQMYWEMGLNLVDLRNCYLGVYDLMVKNKERIADPRGEKHQFMQTTL